LVYYLVIDNYKLNSRTLNEIAQSLNMSMSELTKILEQGCSQEKDMGIQVVNSDWIDKCLRNMNLIKDREFLIQLYPLHLLYYYRPSGMKGMRESNEKTLLTKTLRCLAATGNARRQASGKSGSTMK
jgi:hypothetical protein